MHVTLAARTDFSVGESTLTIEKLVSAAKGVGATAVAITDTMSVTALIDFSAKAKKEGLKPIIGCRLRLTDNPTWRPGEGEKKKHMPREYFVSVYARNEKGLKAIFRLLSLGNSEERFYYVSKLGFDDMLKEVNDDLTVVVGDSGAIYEHPNVDDIVAQISDKCAHTYLGIVPINTPYWGMHNEQAVRISESTGLPLLLIRPALYEKGAADTQEIMGAISTGVKVSDGWHRSRFNRDMHVIGVSDVVEQIKPAAEHLSIRLGRDVNLMIGMFKGGLVNTRKMVDDITYVWEKSPVNLPKMAPDEYQEVVKQCQIGWKKRFAAPVFGHVPAIEDLKTVYIQRLKYELSILEKMDFSGYFLLVQDIVKYSKGEGILVGPGRGSVGGSLVAYLMGITECDPIRFGLLFERFINPERLDLPDADLDFMSERRHEVVDYLVTRFGKDRVAGVSNFGTLGSASSIRDVSRTFGLSEREYSISKFVPKKHGANLSLKEARDEVQEISEFAKKYEPIWNIMEGLEGTIRNFSQHAAGIVVAGCDLVDRAVVEKRTGGPVVCFDKRTVEDQGLVKVDILGLRTLDLMALALQYIKERHGKSPDISAIPLNDPEVLARFAAGKTTAIFQFESGGMRKLLKDLDVGGTVSFEDVTACTALYRPGPMESGMMDSFAKRKQGEEYVEYDHPLMEPILKETLGVIVYQEQVMKISQVIAGYTGPQADKLRKIMGKKLPEEMRKERDNFVNGCVKTIECASEWAGQLFDMIEGFAGYGFNKSHSVEYTLISYQCMWLKVNYPVEFFAAALTNMDADKLPGVIADAKSFGIEVSMPDINHSTDRFEIVTDKKLAIPFQRIKGLSTKTVDAILTARAAGPFADKADFLSRVEKRRCNVRHQANLDKVGAFSFIEPGQPASNDPCRIKDQVELIPGLISSYVPIGREMQIDASSKDLVAATIDEYRHKYGPDGEKSDGMPVKPSFGRRAQFMIISDAPSNQEDGAGVMGLSMSSNAVIDAMAEANLEPADAYWTAMIKRPKRERQVTGDEIATYKPYLDREIEVLKPPVIVLMGSVTTRQFLPGFRGKASDEAGKVFYDKDLDANLVIGFSPGEIYHAPEKQENMNKVMLTVAELL